MKKDIEWLKNEILGLSIKARHKENNQREWHMGHVMALFDVNKLIDQLDEPETLNEEWINEHSKYYTMENAVEISDLKNLLLPQPKKPVIPKFVADWIDAHNLHGNNPLREYRDLENDFNEGWTDEKDAEVYHWVNENPYAFIDALRYGYEVEKEKLYYVLDKEDATLLKKSRTGEGVAKSVGTNMCSVKSWKDEEKYQLTEQEIKAYDERYWVFAQEVTE